MVKLLENTYRSVNIGLINEFAMMCHAMKIDVWEVIEAARTKPFGFMAFTQELVLAENVFLLTRYTLRGSHDWLDSGRS